MAGYARYRKTILNLALGKRYHRMLRASVRGLVRARIAGRTGSKLQRTFLNLSPHIASIYFDNFAVFPRSAQYHLFTADTIDRVGGIAPYAAVRRVISETDAKSLLDRLLYADIKT